MEAPLILQVDPQPRVGSRLSKYKYFLGFQLALAGFLALMVLLNIFLLHYRIVPQLQYVFAAIMFGEL